MNRSVLDQLLPGKVTIATSKPAEPKPVPKVETSKPVAASTDTQNEVEDTAAKVLKIISEEVQLGEGDLALDAEFDDLGVDSLLSLTITGRLREELDIEIPSTAFVDNPTAGALVKSLGFETITGSRSASTPSSSSDKDDQGSSTITSSAEVDTDESDMEDETAITKKVNEADMATVIRGSSSGWPLTDLGVESLLNSSLIDSLSEQIEDESLSDLKIVIREAGLLSKSQANKTWNEDTLAKEVNTKEPLNLNILTPPYASSVLLQGSPRTTKKTLFLFPDGAGSATSYFALPDISPEVCVYGLNCPWLKSPQNLKCTLEQYVAKFLVEVRRRQPQGPYNFGGVSAGGILAYEAARQLAGVGERVDKLILLDTPDPVGLENPNERMYDFLDSLGMFGMDGKGTPKWLRPHFDAFLRVLDAYDVQKFESSSSSPTPAAHIFYARDGMCKDENDPRPEVRPDDPREMRWLINNRTDFTGGGWNTLLGKDNLHITALDDVNHYTILRPGPRIEELSGLIARAL